MSTQRYISTSFWDDEWVETLNLAEIGFYFYFLTNPLTNIAGVFKITDKRIQFNTKLSDAEYKKMFSKFEKAGKVYRIGEYIVLPKWPKHQKWKTHEKIKKGIEAILKDLPPEILRFLLKIKYEFPLENIVNDSLYIGNDSLSSVENPEILPSKYLNLDSDSDIDSDIDLNSCGSNEPPDKQPVSKPKKPPLREREPENDLERVEKVYLQNWDTLYSQKQVNSPEPAVSWGKTRKLLNQHFVKLKPEQIIHALKNGMEDSLVMLNAYSLSFMLTDTHLNRLINKPPSSGPPKHRIVNDDVPDDKLDEFFT